MEVLISPNPVINGIVKISAPSLKAGQYELSIITSTGLKILSKSVYATTYGISEYLRLPNNITKATYYVQITGGETSIDKIFVVD